MPLPRHTIPYHTYHRIPHNTIQYPTIPYNARHTLHALHNYGHPCTTFTSYYMHYLHSIHYMHLKHEYITYISNTQHPWHPYACIHTWIIWVHALHCVTLLSVTLPAHGLTLNTYIAAVHTLPSLNASRTRQYIHDVTLQFTAHCNSNQFNRLKIPMRIGISTRAYLRIQCIECIAFH